MPIKCSTCKIVKDENDFYRHKHGKYGRKNCCKSCERNYQIRSREKTNERMKVWKKNNKEKMKEYGRRYAILHPDKIKEKIKRYYSKDSSKEKKKVLEQNRRAKKFLNGGKITTKDWILIKNKYGNQCLCCGRKDVKLTIDHVVPIISGGRNDVENIQPLCLSCNCKKRTKTIDYR